MTAFNLRAVKVHLVENLDDAAEFKHWLGTVRGGLAVDTETSGLNPWDAGAELRLIQFGDAQQGWSIPWKDWRGLALETLDRWDGEWMTHNLAFETRWLYVHGDGYRFPTDRTHDTMIASRIIDPLQSAALKALSDKHLDRRASFGQGALKEIMAKNNWGWGDVPINLPEYWQYGALDTVLTRGIFDKFSPLITGDGRFRSAYDLDMAVRHIASSMEIRGMRIDQNYAREQYERLDKVHDEVITWGEEKYGINVASTIQLGGLIETLGGQIRERTARGNPKVTKDDLNFWVNTGSPELSTLAQSVIDMRESGKTAETYFKGCIEAMDVDGLVHAEINTLGARTGRMSVSNPPLQQLPRGSALVRNMFIPREGNVLISTDFAQVEMRLMAHFSDDLDLIETFNEADKHGGDFFTTMGAAVYGDPEFSKKDKRRGLVKNVMYGKAYGAGVAKMAASAGVPFEQMEVVADAINTQYPGIADMMKRVEGIGSDREKYEGQGYVLTPFGRRLPCDNDRTYSLVNYLLQGHAAEIFKKSLIDLDSAGYGEFFVVPVHDEILVDLPAELVDEAMREIPDIMSNTTDYSVKILAESEGPLLKWGEKYE